MRESWQLCLCWTLAYLSFLVDFVVQISNAGAILCKLPPSDRSGMKDQLISNKSLSQFLEKMIFFKL